MSHRSPLCVLAATLALAGAVPAADPAPGPAPDVPELKALSHWVGRWDGQLTVKPGDGFPGRTATGTSQTEWVHGGRFARQTWTIAAGDGFPEMSGSSMMTYDPQRKAYRGWTFVSTGGVSEATGTWND